VSAPLDGHFVEDIAGTWKVAGAGNHLGRMPAVGSHDARRVTGVLDRVFGLRFDKDGRFWNSLSVGGSRHDARFNKAIVRRAASHNQPGRYAAFVLADTFGHAIQLPGSGIAVTISRRAQHDDGVEPGERGVGGGRQKTGNHSTADEKKNQQDGG